MPFYPSRAEHFFPVADLGPFNSFHGFQQRTIFDRVAEKLKRSLLLSLLAFACSGCSSITSLQHPKSIIDSKVILNEKLCEVSIEGEINNRLSAEFQKFLSDKRTASNCSNYNIVLESLGGKLYPALTIGRLIRERGFTTSVKSNSECSSACTLLFIAGTGRNFSSGDTRLGFHQAIVIDTKTTYCITQASNDPSIAEFRAYVYQMLQRESANYFIERSQGASCRLVEYVKRNELLKFGIVTQ